MDYYRHSLKKVPMNTATNIKKFVLNHLPGKMRRKLTRACLPDFNLNPEGIIFRPAVTVDDYIKCFRLLHDVYVQSGYAMPSETALRIIPQHSDPESRVFLGCIEDCESMRTPLYTISLFPDNGCNGLPMDTAFDRELNRLRAQGRKIAEVGCLASNPLMRRGDQNIPMLGNKIIHEYAAKYVQADDLVITVHPKYLWVYEDLLLFEQLGRIGSYSYVNDLPAVALRLDLRSAEKRYKMAYAHSPIERDLHHFFFSGTCSAIDLSSEEDKGNNDILERITGYYSLFASL